MAQARAAGERLGSGREARAIRRYAEGLGRATDWAGVEAALARVAGELTRGALVEVLLEREGGQNSVRLAGWPDPAMAWSQEQVEALGYPLCLGLWCGPGRRLALQVYPTPAQKRKGRWSPRIVRLLGTLGALAATAERGLAPAEPATAPPLLSPSPQSPEPGRKRRGLSEDRALSFRPSTGEGETLAPVRDATFLNAVLPFALAQSARHAEPLTVLCVEIDGLAEVSYRKGAPAARGAARRVASALAGALRGSDVVAHLDDDRLIVVLPDTAGGNARALADLMRRGVASAPEAEAGVPLSLSIGVASYPADSDDMAGLLIAADEAIDRRRDRDHAPAAPVNP